MSMGRDRVVSPTTESVRKGSLSEVESKKV